MTTTAMAGRTREPQSVGQIPADAETGFHSLLFPGPEPPIAAESIEAESFFRDLNLHQIVDAVIAGRDEYDLRPFFHAPLRDVDAIVYRHEIMRDIDKETVADALRLFAQRFRELRQHLTLVEHLHYKPNKQGWFLHATKIYAEAVISLKEELFLADVMSRGLLGFRDYLSSYTTSDSFAKLVTEAKRIEADLSTIHYSVLVSGLTVRVFKYEGEVDYSADVAQSFNKFRERDAKDYRVKFSDRSETDHVEGQILEFVARLYPEIFAELDNFCTINSDFQDEVVRRFDREAQFYLAYLGYVGKLKPAGLRFCHPRITDKGKAVHVHDGFDLALAAKLVPEDSSVVCNNFHLRGNERILVVSGPNQGGKTTFARAFGQAHYLGSLGCPVPGSDAQLFLFDRLFTHFAQEEDVTTLRGGLETDLVRIHAILGRATSDSVVILNEIFNSTTIHDAIFLGRKIIEQIIKLDALCVCVTFVDELASLSEKTVSMVSTVVPHDPTLRTYKIVRRPANGLAYALSIAQKYRLTYECLVDRIRS